MGVITTRKDLEGRVCVQLTHDAGPGRPELVFTGHEWEAFLMEAACYMYERRKIPLKPIQTPRDDALGSRLS